MNFTEKQKRAILKVAKRYGFSVESNDFSIFKVSPGKDFININHNSYDPSILHIVIKDLEEDFETMMSVLKALKQINKILDDKNV